MSNQSIWRLSFVMIWLGVAGCGDAGAGGGASRPIADGSLAIHPTGETDMPSDKQDSKFNPLTADESRVILYNETVRNFRQCLTWTDPRVAMQDVRVRTAQRTQMLVRA